MNATDILIIAAQLIGGFVLLFFGGDWLVNGGVAIARRFRISPLVIGMTIVAFGTSAPELLVSTISAIKGSAGIAMGNVIGSNIANIGLILGLTSLICPIETDNSKVVRHGSIMIVASLLLMVFALHSGISRIEGLTLFACLILFTTISIRKGRTQPQEADIEDQEGKPMTILAAIGLIVLSCAMLAFGADILVDGATTLASAMGVSDKVIGLTIVALGTSLPELAASVAAAVKKQMDISIGNIIGSNIFNILCVLGVSTSIKPISLEFQDYMSDFIWMLGFSAFIIIFTTMRKKKGRLGRTAGILFLLAYAIYAWQLF
ncbi:MAG: calcium/sodium antiporter [Bacteroidaceae bacterium]|nr:calcium/sodium antiporter [Bacteroidaceae bacterium]